MSAIYSRNTKLETPKYNHYTQVLSAPLAAGEVEDKVEIAQVKEHYLEEALNVLEHEKDINAEIITVAGLL